MCFLPQVPVCPPYVSLWGPPTACPPLYFPSPDRAPLDKAQCPRFAPLSEDAEARGQRGGLWSAQWSGLGENHLELGLLSLPHCPSPAQLVGLSWSSKACLFAFPTHSGGISTSAVPAPRVPGTADSWEVPPGPLVS